MKLDPLNIGLIITTLVTVLAGWASQRAAAKANLASVKEQAEQEAYSRARAMDDRTMDRQDEEIEDLIKDNRELRKKYRELSKEKQLNEAKFEVTKRALINQINSLQAKLREQNER